MNPSDAIYYKKMTTDTNNAVSAILIKFFVKLYFMIAFEVIYYNSFSL